MVGNKFSDPDSCQSLTEWDLEHLLQWWEDYQYSIFSQLNDCFSKDTESTLLACSYYYHLLS